MKLWDDEQRMRHVIPLKIRLKQLIIQFRKRKHKKDMSKLYHIMKRTERANQVFLF